LVGKGPSEDDKGGQAALWKALAEELSKEERKLKGWLSFTKWRDYLGVAVAGFALFVSLTTLFIAVLKDSALGHVTPLEPSGYAITRGLKPQPQIKGETAPDKMTEITSDDVVLPIDWRNSSGAAALLEKPQLTLTESTRSKEHPSRASYWIPPLYALAGYLLGSEECPWWVFSVSEKRCLLWPYKNSEEPQGGMLFST